MTDRTMIILVSAAVRMMGMTTTNAISVMIILIVMIVMRLMSDE